MHYANSPTRSTGDADLDELEEDLLQSVFADLLPCQVCCFVFESSASKTLGSLSGLYLCFLQEHAVDFRLWIISVAFILSS